MSWRRMRIQGSARQESADLKHAVAMQFRRRIRIGGHIVLFVEESDGVVVHPPVWAPSLQAVFFSCLFSAGAIEQSTVVEREGEE